MAWNCLILKKVIDENRLLFKEGLLQEDMLWSSQLFSYVNCFVFVPKITLFYEFNPNSTMAELVADETRHLPHQLYIINELICSFHEEHMVANTLYIVSELLIVFDVIWKKNNI